MKEVKNLGDAQRHPTFTTKVYRKPRLIDYGSIDELVRRNVVPKGGESGSPVFGYVV